MIGQSRSAPLDEFAEFEALSRAVRQWDPCFDLVRPPTDCSLFETDGMLYAVALADTQIVNWNHRTRLIARGDMMVVPQGVSLEVEPEVNLVAVRYVGPPPDHFRERFIQVWGFEHLPAAAESIAQSGNGVMDVISLDDMRHPLAYAVCDAAAMEATLFQTGINLVLLIALEDGAAVEVSNGSARHALRRGTAVVLGSGLDYRLRGNAKVGRLVLLTALAQDFRRRPSRSTETGGPL